MLIDTHTHVFPDAMAEKTIEILKERILRRQGFGVKTYSEATVSGLKQSMLKCGVDISIAAPIATKPSQLKTINTYAESITDGRIISLATIHPLQENKYNVLRDIKERGFKGIKVHPEFQGVDIDSPEFIEVYKIAEELDLIVLMHAGEDIGVEPPVHSTPARLKNLLNYVSGEKIIAAHMGGWNEWDDVEKYLIDTPVYFDTAVVSRYMDAAQCERIIKAHGTDKILFGSDSPWESPADTLKFLKTLHLSDSDMEKITHKNAENLFGLR